MAFNLLSYGGGVQSVAMVLLVVAGKLPRPEAIIMADTGRERTSTWEYLEQHIQPELAKIGMRVEIAPHSLSTVDLFSLASNRILMPMYTTQANLEVMPETQFDGPDGRKISKLPTYCSSEWKRNVINRYIRQTYGLPSTKVTTWFGFSLDEIRRMKSSTERKAKYPLIETYPLTRDDCKAWIVSYGLPLPQKSACWMCPHMNDREWVDMKTAWPQDFERAAGLERQLQAVDPEVWLHKTARHLDSVEFAPNVDDDESQCGLGLCMI